MSWYKSGTVSVAQNSNAVIGTGTAFIANGRVGDAFQGPDGDWYEVTNIAGDTAMSIAPNYRGATNAAGTYALAPMQGYVKATADALREASLQVGGAIDGLEDAVAEAATSAATATSAKNAAGVSATNAGQSEATALTYKNAAGVSAANAGQSEATALTYKNAAGVSATNSGQSEAAALSYKNAAGVSAGAAAASAATAASRGVGKGYIDGLRLVYTGRFGFTVEAGSAFVPSLGRVVSLNGDAVVSMTGLVASTFYHAYLYEDSGVGKVEYSTTAPVLSWGSTYVKGSDNSRRYLGSLKTSAGAAIWGFRHLPHRGHMMYTEGQPGSAPFVLLSGYNSAAATNIDPTAGSTAIAPNATATEVHIVVAGYGLILGPTDQLSSADGSHWYTSVGATAGDQNIQVAVSTLLSRTPVTQGKFYAAAVTSGLASAIYGVGYSFER